MAGTFPFVSDSTTFGTNGDDTFQAGGAGAENAGAVGRDGNDTFDLGSSTTSAGTVDDSTVFGGFGMDTVRGLGSRDIVYGNQDNDFIRLNGSGNNNTLYGGQGDDVISSRNGANASGGSFLIYGNRNDDFIDLFGADGVSTVYGGQSNDTIIGGFGSDTLGDSLVGGQGEDVIIGIAPASTIYGDSAGATAANSGDDLIASIGGTSTVFGGYGTDIIGSTGSGNVIYGNQDNDAIIDAGSLFTSGAATGGSSTLYGGQGEDVIATAGAFGAAGFAENDVIYGNLGNDLIFTDNPTTGSTGTNVGDQATIYGGQGNDQIVANNSDSVLTGGLGADSYYLQGATGIFQPAPGPAGAGNTTLTQAIQITDFVSGQDQISFAGPTPNSFDYSEVQQTGGLNEALITAENSNTTYTFVAGSTNGYLFYNPTAGKGNSGNPTTDIQVAQLDGLNSTADFASTDIFGGTTPTPANAGGIGGPAALNDLVKAVQTFGTGGGVPG